MEVNYEKVFSNSGLNGFAHRPICPISRVDDLNRKFASFKLCGKRCLGWSFRGDRERNSEKGRLSGANPGLFGMTYTKVREDKFKWVGPLATKRDILVAQKGSGIKVKDLEDAKKVKRIGTLRDDTRGRLLERHGFNNLEPVSDEQLNAKKLALGRIDLWAYKIPGLRTVCDLAGVDYTQFEEVYHLREIDLMIAFSKKTSDPIVQKWRDAFNEMLADGAIMKIRKKWNLKLEDDPFPEIKD
jgi:ABC-type amino acid transport substrate-binding protein